MTTTQEQCPYTELEWALVDRHGILGWGQVGPLTQEQQERWDSYIAYCEESEREHELEMQHGGKTRCPKCDQFTVKHRTVCTYGSFRGRALPGAEFSDYSECTNCDYKEL